MHTYLYAYTALIIWGSHNPQQVVENVRDSLMVNVFCAVSRTLFYMPLFFAEATVTGYSSSICWSISLFHSLYKQCDLETGWGHAPLSQVCDVATQTDFLFWGFVKEKLYIPPMPVDLLELHDRTVNATALVDVTFLNKLRDELEYRLDVCRIPGGSHIEHL
jgi:hypothetical protein